MRWTKPLATLALATGLAAAPLVGAQAVDAHHPERAAAQGAPQATQGGGMPAGPMSGGSGGGMMGGGMMSGMMGGGQGGGMMGPGMMGGMMSQMHGGLMEFLPHAAMQGDLDLTPDQVRDLLEARLILHGNDRLRVGDVTAQDGAVVAAVETVDGSLVRRLRIDPKTGMMQPVE